MLLLFDSLSGRHFTERPIYVYKRNVRTRKEKTIPGTHNILKGIL